MGFEVKIHRIAVNGATVLTERTDALVFGPVRVQLWACGVFEVRDGRITLWRDYFPLGRHQGPRPRHHRRGGAGPSAQALEPSGPAQLAEFLEGLRPAEQPVGGAGQFVAVALLRHRRTRHRTGVG